ncbi:hypothetical protein ANO11243_088350 [Dothideomycetidae sp. 11243]|nr:hypothetical protein ANO11243_088350 [fungal sp. No.11243]
MHEIVTLQFGQQANYVATHFWNAQESYFTYGADEESPVNHDIHFRAGVGADGSDTFTPRTLIYDLKGAFGTLRRDNVLYQSEDERQNPQGQWAGQTQVIQQPAIPPSAYQSHLDSGLEPPPLSTSNVRYWSDYNRVFYHPRSIVQLHEYELSSSIAPFERWTSGQDLFSSLDREHDLLDKDLRPLLEEADHLQAVQVFTNTDDAWGGFAAEYLERVRDELGKTGLWVWALEDGSRESREKQLLHSSNVLQSLNSLASTASMYVPLTTVPAALPNYITGFDSGSRWHTSALQMTAIESISLPSRLRHDLSARSSLDEFEAILSNGGKRRLAMLDLRVRQTSVATNGDAQHHDDLLTGQTPGRGSMSQPRTHVFSQIQSLRGVFKSSLELADLNQSSRDKRSSAAARGIRIACHQTDLLFPLLSSFPNIYDQQSEKVEVEAALSTSAQMAAYVRGLVGLAGRAIGVEDREALVEGLERVAEEYEDGWDGGSDSDED